MGILLVYDVTDERSFGSMSSIFFLTPLLVMGGFFFLETKRASPGSVLGGSFVCVNLN
jgi:hypothetical protein